MRVQKLTCAILNLPGENNHAWVIVQRDCTIAWQAEHANGHILVFEDMNICDCWRSAAKS